MEKIVQVSGFGVNNTSTTQTDYMLVGLTDSGRVVMSSGDGKWRDVGDVGPVEPVEKEDHVAELMYALRKVADTL